MRYQGKIIGIDHIEDIAEWSCQNLYSLFGPDYSQFVQIHNFDGRKGFLEEAPYDIIHVGAASATIPNDLVDQLSKNGRMMIPVGPENGSQYITIVDKDDKGNVDITETLEVRYVPLTSREIQLSSNI